MHSTDMPSDYFGPINIFLFLSGLSLKRKYGPLYKIYSIFSRCMIFMYIPVEVYDLYSSIYDRKMQEVIHLLSTCVPHFTVIAKVILFFYNRNNIRSIMENLQSGIFAPNMKRGGETERIWTIARIRFLNIQVVIYILVWFGILLPAIGIRVAGRFSKPEGTWQFPLYVTYLSYLKESPHYEIAFFAQNLCLTYVGFALLGLDLLMVFLLAHTSLQFEILQNAIVIAVKKAPKLQEYEWLTWQGFDEHLSGLIDYQNGIYDMSHEIERSYNKLSFTIFFANGVSLCCTMFRIAAMSIEKDELVVSTLVYIALILQLVLLCYWGHEATTQSTNVAKAIGKSDWVGSDLKLQKCLLTMLTRSSRPVVFTAGKVIDISLANLLSVVKMSYSYFTVLQNVEK